MNCFTRTYGIEECYDVAVVVFSEQTPKSMFFLALPPVSKMTVSIEIIPHTIKLKVQQISCLNITYCTCYIFYPVVVLSELSLPLRAAAVKVSITTQYSLHLNLIVNQNYSNKN